MYKLQHTINIDQGRSKTLVLTLLITEMKSTENKGEKKKLDRPLTLDSNGWNAMTVKIVTSTYPGCRLFTRVSILSPVYSRVMITDPFVVALWRI